MMSDKTAAKRSIVLTMETVRKKMETASEDGNLNAMRSLVEMMERLASAYREVSRA